MLKYFDKTFFKFVLGFIFIVLSSIAMYVLSDSQEEKIKSSAGTINAVR